MTTISRSSLEKKDSLNSSLARPDWSPLTATYYEALFPEGSDCYSGVGDWESHGAHLFWQAPTPLPHWLNISMGIGKAKPYALLVCGLVALIASIAAFAYSGLLIQNTAVSQ